VYAHARQIKGPYYGEDEFVIMISGLYIKFGSLDTLHCRTAAE